MNSYYRIKNKNYITSKEYIRINVRCEETG